MTVDGVLVIVARLVMRGEISLAEAVRDRLPEIADVWRSSGEQEKHLLLMCPRCTYVSMVSTADEGRALLSQHAWEEHG